MRRTLSLVLVALTLGTTTTAAAQEFYPKDTETYVINYQAFAKDPTTAYLLSAAPGFGAGHFYARNYALGAVMAAGEVIGLGLALLGTQIGEAGSATQTALTVAGGVVFGGFKVADMVLAPASVEEHNRAVAERLKIKPLVMDVGRSPAASGSPIAWGFALAGSTGF